MAPLSKNTWVLLKSVIQQVCTEFCSGCKRQNFNYNSITISAGLIFKIKNITISMFSFIVLVRDSSYLVEILLMSLCQKVVRVVVVFNTMHLLYANSKKCLQPLGRSVLKTAFSDPTLNTTRQIHALAHLFTLVWLDVIYTLTVTVVIIIHS